MRKLSLLLSLLAVCLSVPAFAAPPYMSTSIFAVPLSFEQCRARVTAALEAEGYGGFRELGNGLLGFTTTYAASVSCTRGVNETDVTVVVASESENLAQRDRLVALMRSGVPQGGPRGGVLAESDHLAVAIVDGKLSLRWKNTPGNNQDWINLVPVGKPDDFFQTWYYTGGKRDGSVELTKPEAGDYELRLYLDWPKGGFKVVERLRVRIP